MNKLSKLNGWEHSADYHSSGTAQGYLKPNTLNHASSGDRSACGSNDGDEKPKPASCGTGDDDKKPQPSACGAGDDGKEKPAACGSSCGSEGK